MSKNKKQTDLNNTTNLEDASSDFVVQEAKKENKNNVNKKANKQQNNKKKANANPDKKTLGQRTRATVSELKKVTWPTFGQTVKRTGVVIGFVLIFVVILLGLNTLFGWLFNLIVSSL